MTKEMCSMVCLTMFAYNRGVTDMPSGPLS